MEAVYQLVMETPDINAVVIAAHWYNYLIAPTIDDYSDNGTLYRMDGGESEGVKKAYAQLEKMILQFRSKGKKVYLILNIPLGKELDPRSLVVRSWKHFGLYMNESPAGVNKQEFLQKITPGMERLKGIAQRTDSIVLDPVTWLCDTEWCSPLTTDGKPIYKDAEHLNATFVRERLSVLDQTILKAL